jgi:hypothetical protein
MLHGRHRRTWTDGDTYLVFGLLMLACGAAILQQALIPENWVLLQDEAIALHAVW